MLLASRSTEVEVGIECGSRVQPEGCHRAPDQSEQGSMKNAGKRKNLRRVTPEYAGFSAMSDRAFRSGKAALKRSLHRKERHEVRHQLISGGE